METYKDRITNQTTKVSQMEAFKSFDAAWKAQLVKINEMVVWLTQARDEINVK